MAISTSTEERALAVITQTLGNPVAALDVLRALRTAGIELAETRGDSMVVRWVNVTEQATPPDADTIIRTITTTNDAGTSSTTHWLAGLRGPRGQ